MQSPTIKPIKLEPMWEREQVLGLPRPVWSPDGEKLATHNEILDKNGRIVVSTAELYERDLVNSEYSVSFMGFTPNGRHVILYIRRRKNEVAKGRFCFYNYVDEVVEHCTSEFEGSIPSVAYGGLQPIPGWSLSPDMEYYAALALHPEGINLLVMRVSSIPVQLSVIPRLDRFIKAWTIPKSYYGRHSFELPSNYRVLICSFAELYIGFIDLVFRLRVNDEVVMKTLWLTELEPVINDLCCNSTSTHLAITAGSPGEGKVYILDASDGSMLQVIEGFEGVPHGIVWNDNTIFVADDAGYVRVYHWDAGNRKARLTHVFEVGMRPVFLAYNPRYGSLAVAGEIEDLPYISVYDVGRFIGRLSPVTSTTAPAATPVTASIVTRPEVLGVPIVSVVELLSKGVEGLVSGYPGVKGRVFDVVLSEDIAPEGFEGSWVCVRLGCGGWGCAYRCERGGEVVVFKVPRGYEPVVEEGEALTVSERLMEKIVDLAETIARLRHPHILRLLGYSRDVPLLVYEYADGGSVEWQWEHGWRPSLEDVLLIGVQLADALRYIHSRGLIHCDVKAGNVFFVRGVVRLGDFSSLVKLLSRTSSHSRFAYTPGWRAPEQAYSDLRRRAFELGYENRIDIYQLGNLILYMLTGETVDGEDAVNERVVKEVVDLVEHEALRNLLYRMMSPEPWRRPSAEEVAKTLAGILYSMRR